MSRRPGILADLSFFQLAVGALAAMTSAWVASTLGVAGTIIGAALGSLVVGITSAFYSRTLDRGRTLVVQTEDGRSVETRAEPGATAEALHDVAEATDSPVRGAEVVEEGRRTPWRTVIVSTVAVLALALAAMGAYELASGQSYGSNPDNARIGNPFSGGSSSTQDQQQQDDDGGTTDPGDGQDEQGTDPEPSAPAEEPEPTATPTPTPSPSAPEPTPAPTPTR